MDGEKEGRRLDGRKHEQSSRKTTKMQPSSLSEGKRAEEEEEDEECTEGREMFPIKGREREWKAENGTCFDDPVARCLSLFKIPVEGKSAENRVSLAHIVLLAAQLWKCDRIALLLLIPRRLACAVSARRTGSLRTRA